MGIRSLFRSSWFVASVTAAALTVSACGGSSSGGVGVVPPPPPPPPTLPPPSNGNQPYSDPTAYSSARSASLASAVEAAAITRHQITLRGNTIDYTATTGHLTARNATGGAEEASFFYVAYTIDNQNAATRPVTFFYNGGPGSATVWLHLGSFGPKRLVTGDPSTNGVTPFPLVDNDETLLDTTDLVFVDAIGAGYSEAIAPNTNQTFWGVDQDARVFRDFVVRYLTVNNRLASPKFLFGESYGTTRSAVLANLLETAGIQLSGVVLQSSVLNYNSNCGVVNVVLSCSGYLPSYGATGAYFNLAVPAPTDLLVFEQQLRDFTVNTYAPADLVFLTNRTLPATSVLNQLQGFTGIPVSLWSTNFNLGPGTFQSQLRPGQLIGRYDGRVSAPVGSPLASQGDPSSTFITGQFVAAINSYLVSFLQYGNGSTYVLLGTAINTWDFSHDRNQLPDTIPDLAAALAQNPVLKVLAVNGYHDLATPFYQTEVDLARLGNLPNVSVRNYAGGHMTYLDDTSRPLERADLTVFYQSALVVQ
ncbi:MAG TPA: peptidase S10 [Burkholderiaceae bacterium]|nr:peptidase S10 [Burkholderiaceae bacterium]